MKQIILTESNIQITVALTWSHGEESKLKTLEEAVKILQREVVRERTIHSHSHRPPNFDIIS